eukprot:3188007-Rhodomonas_salina.5
MREVGQKEERCTVRVRRGEGEDLCGWLGSAVLFWGRDYWNGGVVIECNLNSCTEPLVWLNDLHVFDPVNNTWTDLSSSVSGTPPPANYGTRSVGMAALEGRLFVLGGGKRVGLANPAPVDSVRGETMFRLICHVVESGDNKCSCQDKGERFHVVRLRL